MSAPLPRARRIFSASLASLTAATALGASIVACSLGSDVDSLFQEPSGTSSTGTAGTSSTGTAGTSSTGTAGTGGMGGTGGATGAGGSAGAEDCTDGVDNDKNGLIDCADPACQPDYECVDAAPGDWSYYLVEETPYPGPSMANCENGATPETYFTDPAGPAQCSACSCGPAVCDPPSITCWPGSQGCNGNGQDWSAQLSDGMCHKPMLMSGTLSCRLSTPPGGGSCQPSSVDFANKAPWAGQVTACASNAIGGGCGAGKACMPKPTAPTESACIMKKGQASCPSGWSTVVQGFEGGTDTRSCTACACEVGGATCSGGSYTFYDLDSCVPIGGNAQPINVDSNTCRNISPLLEYSVSGSWSVKANLPMPTGGCAPKGGEPTGEVQAQGPITFCCK